MKLSVCINSVTGNLSKPDAMRLSKSLGFSAVEFWEGSGFPVDEYKAVLDETGLTLALMGGGRDLINTEARPAFIADVKTAIENAKKLGAKNIIGLAGQELAGVSRRAQYDAMVEGLKEAAKLLEGTGITMCLEPLNVLVNHPGYFLYRSDEAFAITREVNSPHVKILFDVYHQQITEGNLIANITENIDIIGHFHVAGNPGRGEPYLGEINYKEVFKAADEAGYTGFAGLEYWPKKDSPEESLKRVLAELV